MDAQSPTRLDVPASPRRTPLTLITAHAQELTLATGGRLVGVVLSGMTGGGDFEHALSVRAPSLRDHTLRVLRVTHTPDLGTLRMRTDFPKGSLDLRGLDELEAALHRVLVSSEFTEEVRVLLLRTIL